MLIGIDFDNTIVSYDKVMYEYALSKNLIDKNTIPKKQFIRDKIRDLFDGELLWQKMQAEVYGKLIQFADPVPGVIKFMKHCQDEQVQMIIVSHKTEYAKQDKSCNLHDAAKKWIRTNIQSAGISIEVYFENTRTDKINRIKKLSCTHFIDDLELVFTDSLFPKINRFLLNECPSTYVNSYMDWEMIEREIFAYA